jgi:hypothetical protein
MVIPTLGGGWAARLERLRRLAVDQPDGPTWLWAIRIRILEFLVDRYSDPGLSALEDSAATPPLKSAPEHGKHIRPVFAEDEAPVRWARSAMPVRAEHPPKAKDIIAPLLEQIERVNDEHRNLHRPAPPCDAVWEWWRATWCLPPPSRHQGGSSA